MASKIPYCDETWEVTGGCTKISAGCQNCYAIPMVGNRLAHIPRYKGLVETYPEFLPCGSRGEWTGKIKLFEDRLNQPLHWKAPRTIFVCPRSDLFHPAVPFEFVDKMMIIIANCKQHTFLVLTKRPQGMLEYFKDFPKEVLNANQTFEKHKLDTALIDKLQKHRLVFRHFNSFPPENLYLGATICNQAEADEKAQIHLQIPGNLWYSFEPLLGPIKNFDYYLNNLTTGQMENMIKWVVIGCESGPNRRPCKLDWMIDLVEQCQAAGVPVYVKQVPLPTIKALREVRSDIPGVAIRVIKGKIYKTIMNDYGAISAITEKGILGLKPDEFETIGSYVSHNPDEWPKRLRVRDEI